MELHRYVSTNHVFFVNIACLSLSSVTLLMVSRVIFVRTVDFFACVLSSYPGVFTHSKV